jgi:hypothetical protein
MVRWNITFNDGTNLTGMTDDGSWKLVPDFINRKNLKIVSMNIGNDFGIGRIDNNCDGYYLNNKIIAIMQSKQQVRMVGIGYWRKHESVVRIKWYNADNMELIKTEAQPVNEIKQALIKNI